MKSVYYLLLVILVTIASCGTSKTVDPVEAAALEKLVTERNFIIENDWAYPQTTMAMQRVLNSGILQPGSTNGNISLVGNYNFLKISGDSITSYLPYFGERQMNVDYGGGDSTIKFEGLLENFKAFKNKKNGYTVTFNAQSLGERFTVYLTISPGLRTDMVLNSSSRNTIRYSGEVTQNVQNQQ